ncbi:hypothetical protein PHYBOEH_001408 [Phytophthora boehmeriae]|uniref:Pseudouridine synthase RsuA/RluA-like domain-containing protein n=1 Tax=Phytophthora boehmeriae TaxID=109152 RepID=A0A8T1X6L2_9STRA|nr:hypothetical protein PHYBOEH_001408 [Phytophthora boehmeriae]
MADTAVEPSVLPLSKKQQRKQDKARWLAERKAKQLAEGLTSSKRKRRNQRKSRVAAVDASARSSPTVHYEDCASTTCANRSCRIRTVAPYLHCFALYAKGRWAGRSLRELFAEEFPTLSASYCSQAARLGLVRLNGEPADLDAIVNEGDFLEHLKHRHEPSVHLPASNASALSTTWIHFETDDVMVVDKPSGLPVHPTGSYQFNSLTYMLQHDRSEVAKKLEAEVAVVKPLELFPVHRLDRLTSGLLLLGKTPDKARSLTAELTATSSLTGDGVGSRSVRKFYVARVQGEFPESIEGFAGVEGMGSGLVKIESTSDGFWRVTAPIGMMSPRQGHTRCVSDAEDAKPCVTLVRRRGEVINGESIVECLLVTGRTHQIRVHLQHLGFPIVNDPLYGPAKIVEKNATEMPSGVDRRTYNQTTATTLGTNVAGEKECQDSDEQRSIRVCENCIAEKEGSSEEDVVLWLHSFRYESPDWSFSVPLPCWASLS